MSYNIEFIKNWNGSFVDTNNRIIQNKGRDNIFYDNFAGYSGDIGNSDWTDGDGNAIDEWEIHSSGFGIEKQSNNEETIVHSVGTLNAGDVIVIQLEVTFPSGGMFSYRLNKGIGGPSNIAGTVLNNGYHAFNGTIPSSGEYFLTIKDSSVPYNISSGVIVHSVVVRPGAVPGWIAGNITLNGGNGDVENVEVTCYDYFNNLQWTTNPTSSGFYGFYLAPLVYTVVASLNNYNTASQVTVLYSGYTNNVNLTLDYIGIYGTVEGNVSLSGGTGNVENAFVREDDFGYGSYCDSNGDYSLQIPSGTYDFTSHLDGYEDDHQTDITVTVGNTTSNVDFTLNFIALTGTLSGIITLDDNTYGNVEDVTLQIGNQEWNPDSDGFYSKELPITNGNYYTMFVSLNNYTTETIEPIEINEDETTTVDVMLLALTMNINITPDNLKLTNIEVDGVKFIGDNFFTREPRRCNLEFMTNDWLLENFVYSGGDFDSNINVVIYYDENGDVINEITGEMGHSIGTSPSGTEIADKEVIIQQISKIAVRVKIDNENEYIGFIDKSTVTYDKEYISFECVGLLWIFKQFGEQLIKNINGTIGEGEIAGWVWSRPLIDELVDKTKDLTNINFDIEHNNQTYNGDITEETPIWTTGDFGCIINHDSYLEDVVVENLSVSDSSDILLLDASYDTKAGAVPPADNGTYFFHETGQSSGAPITNCGLGYRIFKVKYEDTQAVNAWGISLIIVYKEWEFDTDNISFGPWGCKSILLYRENFSGGITEYKTEAEALSIFNSHLRDYYVKYDPEEEEDLLYWIWKNDNDYKIQQINQDYYSFQIPVYNDTYSYLELIKTILFLNGLTIYTDENGQINISEVDFDNYSPEYLDDKEILKPFSFELQTREDINFEVMDKVWYDTYEDNPENNGQYYVGADGSFLDTYLKNKYQTLFNKLPKKVSFSILASSIDDDFGIYSVIQYTNELGNNDDINVLVTQYKRDKHNFSIEIEGYMIDNEFVDYSQIPKNPVLMVTNR